MYRIGLTDDQVVLVVALITLTQSFRRLGFSLSRRREIMVMLLCVLTTLLVLPIALLLDLRDQFLEMPS